MSETDDILECQLRAELVELDRRWQLARQPYIEELVKIEARRPPRPIIIPLDELKQIKWILGEMK